jgi:V-type H+-transporting ATPase proteolipid subunit
MHISVMRPDLMMRCSIPIIMAGIVGLYGLIVNVLLIGDFTQSKYPLYTGALHLAAGLCVGLSGLAAGISIGVVGDAGVRGVAQQPRLFVGMILILIFSEVLGLYGAIIAILIKQKAADGITCA